MKFASLLSVSWSLWVAVINSHAQSGNYLNSEYYSNFLPKTSKSSTLGQFGNVPVNYYAGVPEISFELLRLKGREIEIPISISYDASGVKTDEFSGDIGLKWTISAGGYVAREMNSLPDEHTAEGYWKYSKETNYYSNLDYPKWVNWCEKNERDGAPDEFVVVIPGRSIKFVFNKDKKIVAIPRQNVRISHTMLGDRINGFELITEDGTRYLFGGSAEAIASRRVETLNIRFKYNFQHAVAQNGFASDMYKFASESLSTDVSFEENATDIYNSRWYLKSIVSPAGETTRFFYQNTSAVTYAARPSALRLAPAIELLDNFTYGERRCKNYGFFECDEWEYINRGPFNSVAAVIKYPRTYPGSVCNDANCGGSVGFFYPRDYRATPGHLNNYFTLVTESDVRLLRIESATGNKVLFTSLPRVDLPGAVRLEKVSLQDMNGIVVSSFKFNYKDVVADESKDFMWPGEALIMFHVGEVTEAETNFTAHHIRKYFSNRISDAKLNKYVYEGLKEYNYRRSFLESVEQLSKNTTESIHLYKFEYLDPQMLKRRTTTMHNDMGFQRTDDYGTEWTFQSGKKAFMIYDNHFDLHSNAARLYGMLSSVTFPSGGYSKFVYDPATPNPRLKLVQDFDENNNVASQKEIDYLTNALTGFTVNICAHDFNIWGTSDWMKYMVTSTSALNEPTLTHNVAQGHKKVRVYYGTKTLNTGFEEFIFTSSADAPYRNISAPIYSDPIEQNANGENLAYLTGIYPFPKSRDRDYLRGMPLSHAVYASGKTMPLKQTLYTYEVNPYGYVPEAIIGLKGGSFNYASHAKVTFWYGHETEVEKRSRYSRYSYEPEWVVLKKTRTITYDPSVSDTTRNFDICTEYEYDPIHLQQVEERIYHRDSPQEKKILRTRYVTHQDYDSPAPTLDCQQQLANCLSACDAHSDPNLRSACYGNCYNQFYSSCTDANKQQSIAIQALRNKHQINTPVEVQNLVAANGQTRVVKSILYKYVKQGTGAGFTKPNEIYDLSQSIDINGYTSSRIQSDGTFAADSRLRLAHTFNNYDPTTANVQKQTSRDGTTTSYQWGFNNSIVTGFQVNPGAQQQQYLYDHNLLVGLRSTTDPNGRMHRFEYDGFNRLRLTRDHDNNILSRYRYHYLGQNESLSNDSIITSCQLANSPISLQSIENVPLGQTTYQWDFGDGTPAVKTTALIVDHTWPQKGQYIVKVRKENPEYFSREAVRLISVYTTVSAVNLNINGPTTYDICSLQPPPRPTTILATISGDAFSYICDFRLGEGPWTVFASGAGPVFKVSIPAPSDFGSPFTEGVFTIRFTAFDACGNGRSAETTLTNYKSTPGCFEK